MADRSDSETVNFPSWVGMMIVEIIAISMASFSNIEIPGWIFMVGMVLIVFTAIVEMIVKKRRRDEKN